MRLNQLLQRLEYTCLQGRMDIEVAEIINDSRKAKEGSLFFCIRGAVTDGHKYAKEVAEKGAAVLIVEEPVDVPEHTTVIQVADTRYAMALISAAWYGIPGGGDEDYRRHRYKGKDDDDLHGQVDPRSGRI